MSASQSTLLTVKVMGEAGGGRLSERGVDK